VAYSKPPYNPGFGFDPPLLAGRDEVLSKVGEALRTGPRDPDFCLALTGERGVGKTVVLNKVQRDVEQDLGWPVVVLQAIPESRLLPQLAQELMRKATSGWQRTGALAKAVTKEVDVSANLLVVKASAKVSSAPPASQDSAAALERLFTMVGEFAQKRESGVLITIDEAHVMNRLPELTTLGAVLQLVVKRKQLPISVLFAGLPEMRQRFRGVGTFLERIGKAQIGNLSKESTEYALYRPAKEHRVTYDEDALAFLIAESEGYPYLVQLLGYRVWEAAQGSHTINLAHARAGAKVAASEMSDIFRNRWDDLSDLERDYAYAVATTDSRTVSTAEVRKRLGRTSPQLSTTRQQLIEVHAVLAAPRHGEVEIPWQRFREWIARQDWEITRRSRR
jgi:type II secretory pathway predicted ATPase ExeA